MRLRIAPKEAYTQCTMYLVRRIRLYLSILLTSLLCIGETASAKVLFKADFETGDLSQWSTTGTRSQNATPRNVQVVTDIVQEGKYAGKFTIHEDDVFNDRQLRVQVGGPRVTVEEGSDTYMSFYMYMAEPPKDRDNFFYWEGNPPPRYNNVMTWLAARQGPELASTAARGFLSSRTNVTSSGIAVSLRMHRERRMDLLQHGSPEST